MRDSRNLTVNSQEEGPILDPVKVQSVDPVQEVESSDETSFIAEHGTIDKVHCLSMLLSVSVHF